MVISLENLIKEYSIKINGIIHIGGHRGSEINVYKNLGVENAIFFEPLSNNYAYLSEALKNTNYIGKNIALGNVQGNIDMYVEDVNQSMSSSILKPKKHLEQYPGIVFTRMENVIIDKLDNVDINLNDYNFINMDVQGYELEVLKGATETLNKIDYIYCEVNNDELYENCALIDELDKFLSTYSFKREVTDWCGGTWGDALYIKTK
jgi:FkbM family methyltransferase